MPGTGDPKRVTCPVPWFHTMMAWDPMVWDTDSIRFDSVRFGSVRVGVKVGTGSKLGLGLGLGWFLLKVDMREVQKITRAAKSL